MLRRDVVALLAISGTGLSVAGCNRDADRPPHAAQSDCVAAYRQLERDAQETPGVRSPPPRAEFIAYCSELSLEEQQCLDPLYEYANQQQCKRIAAAMAPKETARLRALFMKSYPPL